jgi:predicted nuclease of restriction endonuclease-like (RecB) superfamily
MAKKLLSKTKPTRAEAGTAGRRVLTKLASDDARFAEVVALIEAARSRTYQAVNAELVTLYWKLGEHISGKITNAEWGDGVVDELATSLARRFPGMRGYTRRNLFRMRQFYEAYPDHEKVSALLTQLPWTHHLLILGQVKLPEAREFYVLAAIRGRRAGGPRSGPLNASYPHDFITLRFLLSLPLACKREGGHLRRLGPQVRTPDLGTALARIA